MAINLSEDQFKKLLATIGAGKQGSFASCTASYDGRRDPDAVEAFLATIQVFKNVENISDLDALTGLPLLLKDDAGVWWQGIKEEVKTCPNFEARFRESFAPKKLPYSLYMEIMSEKQLPGVSTESFIAKKRMLFAQLPSPKHTECQQLDMIYGLLSMEVRSSVPRSSVNSFIDLVHSARAVENMMQEKSQSKNSEKMSLGGKFTKPRCTFCRYIGHNAEECRKKKRAESTQISTHQDMVTQAPSPSQPKFSCFGCGAPGVVRTNCPTCSRKSRSIKNENLSFCAINVRADTRSRPVVFISIGDTDGIAYRR